MLCRHRSYVDLTFVHLTFGVLLFRKSGFISRLSYVVMQKLANQIISLITPDRDELNVPNLSPIYSNELTIYPSN